MKVIAHPADCGRRLPLGSMLRFTTSAFPFWSASLLNLALSGAFRVQVQSGHVSQMKGADKHRRRKEKTRGQQAKNKARQDKRQRETNGLSYLAFSSPSFALHI
jgi:hypothetical protein